MTQDEFDKITTAISKLPKFEYPTFVFYVNGKKYTIKAESYSIAYYVILPKLVTKWA